MRTTQKGLVVVELLVVVAMVGILAGLLLPALQNMREAARRDVCSDNMRKLALGLLQYHDSFEVFPPAIVTSQHSGSPYLLEPAPVGGLFWSWAYRIAPFIGFQDFFDQIDPLDHPFWSLFGPGHPYEGISLVSYRRRLFGCPADPRYPIPNWVEPGNHNHQAAITSYLGVNGRNQFAEDFASGQDGMLYVNSSVSIEDVTDGISNTVILGERPPTVNLEWGWTWAGAGNSPSGVWFGTTDVVLGVHELRTPPGPNQISDYFRPGEIEVNLDRYHFWSFHPDGGNWAFADGSTRFLSYLVDSAVNETTDPDSPPTVLAQFATRAGGLGLSTSDLNDD